MTHKLGIMQGRLVPPAEPGRIQSFPRDRWREEFAKAAAAHLSAIELIFDSYGLGVNPIETDAGVREIQQLAERATVSVDSLVADYFMDSLLIDAEGGAPNKLAWLLSQCRLIGITRVVLPFVDSSSMRTAADLQSGIHAVERALRDAEDNGVELHLETDLEPKKFAGFLGQLDHPLVKVNYDSGNSASLGFNVHEEFAAYGPRVGSVHLKDRVRGGTTVPLGNGDADFEALFSALAATRYNGDFILQVARGPAGGELEWAIANRRFFEPYLDTLSS